MPTPISTDYLKCEHDWINGIEGDRQWWWCFICGLEKEWVEGDPPSLDGCEHAWKLGATEGATIQQYCTKCDDWRRVPAP